MHTSLLLQCALALLESFFRIVDAKCKKIKNQALRFKKILFSFPLVSQLPNRKNVSLFAVTRLLLYLCCVGNWFCYLMWSIYPKSSLVFLFFFFFFLSVVGRWNVVFRKITAERKISWLLGLRHRWGTKEMSNSIESFQGRSCKVCARNMVCLRGNRARKWRNCSPLTLRLFSEPIDFPAVVICPVHYFAVFLISVT